MKPLIIGDLKIPFPVVQGGMGIGVSLSGLASAVANMGGVGVISTIGIGVLQNRQNTSYTSGSIDALRDEIKKAKEKTAGVLGVNIMSVITNFSDMVKTSIEEGIDVIFSGAGLPLDLPKYLTTGSRTKLVPIVSSGRAANLICNKWYNNYSYLPDAFVVEGPKAGGHLGFKADDLNKDSNTLEDLVKKVQEVSRDMYEKYQKKIPVIAAGGIFSGTDMFNIINEGADAVQMGTRFVATDECDASQEFKDSYVNAKEDDVKIIKSPVGMPGRAIHNQFIDDSKEGLNRPKACKYSCLKTCNPKETLYCIFDALQSACKGKLESGFAFAGSNVFKVSKIQSVKQVFEDLKNEYLTAKGKSE